MNQHISIVLTAHKSKDLIINYIKNLYQKFHIIVIDNSNDIELEKEIKTNYQNVTFDFMSNKGYGAAINCASKFVKTKYFLVSNPDVEGITTDSIIKFYEAAININDQFSMMGPVDLDHKPERRKTGYDKTDLLETNQISGICMFFNKKNFDAIGGFDENIFLYFEEIDFCRQTKIKGGKIYSSSKLIVKHLGHKGSAATDPNYTIETEMFRNWHWMWSSFYYHKKYSNYLLAMKKMFGKFIKSFFKMIFFAIIFNKKKQTMYFARYSGLLNAFIGRKSWYRVKSLFK